jgi:superfamily II DNA or RNA helicase
MIKEKELKIQIEYLTKEIFNIKENVENVSLDIILDSYEITENCYKFISSKDNLWFTLFIKNLEMTLKEYEYDINNGINELKSYDMKNHFYQSFICYIENEIKKYHILKIENINDYEHENNVECDNVLEINQEELIKTENFEGLRKNQELARENNKKYNFCSGVHNQITGAGKSIIAMLTINDHNEMMKENNGKLYIYTCPRIEVLRKMFFEKIKIDDKEVWIINKKNKKFWKENKIIDLDNFNLIDRVNIKDKRKLKLKKNKPNILIVNSDYLKALHKMKSYKYKKVILVLFDECHGVSAKYFYELLEKIKFTYKKHIIGFSATPVRDNAEEKVKQIFSSSLEQIDNPKLNIISNYDMMNAICDNIVLPPSYTIVEIKKTCNKKIGKSNKDITEKVLKNKILILPYKKLICWCGTISKLKEWYIFFQDRFPELTLYCSTSKDNEHKNFNTDYDKFCDAEKNSILLCVNRCKEGSDIKNLDCGIYIDHVKKRGILVSIQTVGRILRPDKDKLKKCGYIIDTFINDGKIEIEIMTAHKVISYYEKVLTLSSDENLIGMIEIYNKMKEMCLYTEYDSQSNKIKIKLDDLKEHDTEIKLELTTKNFDWTKFKDKLEKIIDNNFGISQEDKFNIIIEKLKKTKKFNVEIYFWNTYLNLDKKKLNLPTDLYSEYKEFFDKKTWFELMDFDISIYYKTIYECKNAIKNLNHFHDGIITNKNYDILKIYDKKLPPFPQEFFKLYNFTTIKKEFSENKNKNENFI